MPAAITLHPQWKPLNLPSGSVPYGGEWFTPCVVDEHGVAIVGGANALHLLQIFQHQRLWFSIPARVAISGFAVNGSTLYVQDGAVLSAWDLAAATQVDGHPAGLRLAGINLASLARWNYDQTPVSEAQLAELYRLPPPLADLQGQIREHNRRVAWNHLLIDLRALPQDPGNVELQDHLGHRLGGDAEITAGPADSEALTYSAPVVRQQQTGAAAGGLVFVLAGDGMFHALDGDLNHMSRLKLAAPRQLELTLVETPSPQDPNLIRCTLYYPLAAGGIHCIDGMTTPPTVRGAWPGPPPESSSPRSALAYAGGGLWARDVLGKNITALPLDPPGPPIFVADDEATAWQDCQVDATSGLVLATSETRTRLLAYPPGSLSRDRWGAVEHRPSWMRFVPGSSLVLQIEHEAATPEGNIPATVRAANTVGAPHPEWCVYYPYPPTVLAAGFLAPEPFGGILPRIATLKAPPVVSRQELYGVTTPGTTRQQLAAWIAPQAGGPSDSSVFIAATKDPDSLLTSFPPATTHEFLVGFSLSELVRAVEPAAHEELDHNRGIVSGIAVPLQRQWGDPKKIFTPPWRIPITLLVKNQANQVFSRLGPISVGPGDNHVMIDPGCDGGALSVEPGKQECFLGWQGMHAFLHWSSNVVPLHFGTTEPLILTFSWERVTS